MNDIPRPWTDPDLARSLQKPKERRVVVKRKARRAKKLTRAQVVAATWRRFFGRCARCLAACVRPRETYPTDPLRGEVNDIVPRSKGGDPLDPLNQELICHRCHFGGPSGGHAPTKERMVKR